MKQGDGLSVTGVAYQSGATAMASAGRETLVRREETVRRLVLVSILYLLLPLQAMLPILDPDIWWHLRTGQWLVEHWAVPITDPFSAYGMGKPWVAYSWLCEVLLYGLHHTCGLSGVVLYTVVLSFLITGALHSLVRKFALSFPAEVALTALGLMSMKPLISPRPWLFTILFFIIELDIILLVRRSGDTRRLLLLPPLFALWANIHLQFVYGLFVVGLAAAEPFIDKLFRRHSVAGGVERALLGRWLLVTAACCGATLATPYGWSLYQPIGEIIRQTGAFQYVNELLSLEFREPWDWCVLAVTLGAVFSLGWRREVRPFPLLLLAVGACLSFRARRDVWFVVVTAVTLIASCHAPVIPVDRFRFTKFHTVLVMGVVLIAFVALSQFRRLAEADLEEALAKTYPAAAAAFVEERRYPGPLYNHFNWGGYLIWRLPRIPVSVDGRTNVHGDERIGRSFKTWAGGNGWASDPELAAARLVIAQVNEALTALLRLDPRFEVMYEDKVAVVFVARPRMEQKGRS